MSEEEKKEEKNRESGQVSRREFLVGAGFLAGGAAIGAGIAYPLASGGEDGEDVTKYVCPYDTQEFATLAALETHLDAVHGGESPDGGGGGGGGTVIQDARTTLTINGVEEKVEVKPTWTLAFVLREKLGLTGTHIGCNRGSCGACSVIVDGRSVYSCMMLAIESEGLDIQTIEGLAPSADGLTLHPLQQSFVDRGAQQCGYCTPGFLMAAKALWDKNPNPTLAEASIALSGHICSCGHLKAVLEAVTKEVY